MSIVLNLGHISSTISMLLNLYDRPHTCTCVDIWIFDDLTLYFFTSDVLDNLNQTAYILKQIEHVSEYREELIKTMNVGLQPQIF